MNSSIIWCEMARSARHDLLGETAEIEHDSASGRSKSIAPRLRRRPSGAAPGPGPLERINEMAERGADVWVAVDEGLPHLRVGEPGGAADDRLVKSRASAARGVELHPDRLHEPILAAEAAMPFESSSAAW